MQLKIDLPDILPHKKVMFLIKEIEDILSKEGIPLNIKQESLDKNDPWDNLNIEDIAVDTGIEDFAKNHDHYLYGTFMKPIFVDTSALIAIGNKRDIFYSKALELRYSLKPMN